jgi:hypothetical protein
MIGRNEMISALLETMVGFENRSALAVDAHEAAIEVPPLLEQFDEFATELRTDDVMQEQDRRLLDDE